MAGRSRQRRFSPACVLLALAAPVAASGPPLTGTEAEEFLRVAKVVKTEHIPRGVTRPQRLTLDDGARTADAAWKTIDVYRPVMDFRDGRPPEIGFRDSWKHEIAAYELDKLLGLDMVPATVARRIKGRKGSLQLWIENAMTEDERRERGISAPDVEAWNQQVYKVRLLRQLTHDTDFNNIGNLLVGRDDFRLWAIDHSRAFKTRRSLLAAGDLTRFSTSLLERLSSLDAAELKEHLSPWLTRTQQEALLARRDLIVKQAERLVEEQGADSVLYP